MIVYLQKKEMHSAYHIMYQNKKAVLVVELVVELNELSCFLIRGRLSFCLAAK